LPDSIDALRPFLNIRTDSDFVLVVAWLCAALRNDGPYPVLAVSGEQGLAKYRKVEPDRNGFHVAAMAATATPARFRGCQEAPDGSQGCTTLQAPRPPRVAVAHGAHWQPTSDSR
jgi:hypothetical protein